MTSRWSCTAVATLCCLLAVVTSASVEGVWTLWTMGAEPPCDSVATFPTREQCVEAVHQQAQGIEKLGLKVTEDAAGPSFSAADADRVMRGQCLSDTVDPRGTTG